MIKKNTCVIIELLGKSEKKKEHPQWKLRHQRRHFWVPPTAPELEGALGSSGTGARLPGPCRGSPSARAATPRARTSDTPPSRLRRHLLTRTHSSNHLGAVNEPSLFNVFNLQRLQKSLIGSFSMPSEIKLNINLTFNIFFSYFKFNILNR